jgi:RND family efflux transporter MFP subunit
MLDREPPRSPAKVIDAEPAVRLRSQPPKPSGGARALKAVLLVALVVLIAGWVVFRGISSRIQSAAAVKDQTLALAVPTVAVIHPRPGALADEVVLPGNIQAFMDSPIYARASGYLKRWYADIGARVKSGQVLAEIDAPELDQQVRQARADVQQSQAALDQALANSQQGKANEELAKVTADRWRNLAGKGVVSRQENDQYQAQYQAQAASVQSLEKAIAAARSSIVASQANVGRLEEMQRYTTVRAPFDGVITARNTDVGALINAGAGTPTQELFHIASTAKLRVYVNVPQSYSRSAVPGLAATLTLAEFPGRRFHGMLVRNAESIDTGTRTLLTEVDVDNASGELKPGAYAEVHLAIPAAARSLILPVNAFLFRSEGLRVGVVRAGGKVELVPVIVGKDYGTELEVVSGIDANDQVILNPPDSLTSGEVVHVAPAEQPAKR